MRVSKARSSGGHEQLIVDAKVVREHRKPQHGHFIIFDSDSDSREIVVE